MPVDAVDSAGNIVASNPADGYKKANLHIGTQGVHLFLVDIEAFVQNGKSGSRFAPAVPHFWDNVFGSPDHSNPPEFTALIKNGILSVDVVKKNPGTTHVIQV